MDGQKKYNEKKMDGWMDKKQMDRKNICMVGRIKKWIKNRWMVGWLKNI